MSFDFDDFDVRARFSELDDRTDELRQLLRDLPDEKADFEERCRIAYIYHDSALEGVVLTYHELRAAVDRKVSSDSTLIPTYQEIRNHADALNAIEAVCRDEAAHKPRARHPRVTVEQGHELQVLLTKNLLRRSPGALRKDMPLHRTYFHDIFEPAQIEAGLVAACGIVDTADFRAQHPINQACLFHCEYMKVFPYTDSSGKVGRLLMNYFLIRAGYLPAVIHFSDRQAYYEALKDGPEALRRIVVEAMAQAVDAGVRHLRERLKARSAVRGRSLRSTSAESTALSDSGDAGGPDGRPRRLLAPW
ncbi:MAG: cell filamentation protein Fic [Deltaproteobacteria bacterium]|nr:cell filamentation protein Fic [Deltaproteobacteria bacterium]